MSSAMRYSSSALSIGPFQKVQHEVTFSSYAARNRHKLPISCSIHDQNREILKLETKVGRLSPAPLPPLLQRPIIWPFIFRIVFYLSVSYSGIQGFFLKYAS